MSKLTLPILCAYAAVGVTAKLSQKGIFNLDEEYPEPMNRKSGPIRDFGFSNGQMYGAIQVSEKYSIDFCETDEIVLNLRPLSSLTKPITHNGEAFVPLVKLASIQFPEVEFTIEDNRCFGRLNVGVVLEFVIDDEIPFYKEYHNNIFGQSKSDDYDDMALANITPSEIREKLKEWHMDLWNLLESGDALPIEEDGK